MPAFGACAERVSLFCRERTGMNAAPILLQKKYARVIALFAAEELMKEYNRNEA